MDIEERIQKIDQSKIEKSLEEAKKQMSETNKKFAEAMQEIKKKIEKILNHFLVLINSPFSL